MALPRRAAAAPFPSTRACRGIALCTLAVLLHGAWPLNAQQTSTATAGPSGLPGSLTPMGAVATRDARITGGLAVRGDQAQLLTNASVTAFDRTAPITLARGGEVLVCSTSEFHLLRSGAGGALIFGLNRGALEIRSVGQPQDVVLTPDLKLAPITPGPLNLSLRVTPEGDTCVNNAGPNAPVLLVNDAFSSASYRVLPGQHLLFVKGDLHRVVDHERSPCGCPATVVAQVVAAKPGSPLTPSQAAAAHPFPEAQSAGLAPITPSANQAAAGVASSQVTTSFTYGDGGGTAPPPASETASPTPSMPTSTPSSPPPAPARHGFGGALRRFFHRLFHPSAD